MRRTVWIIDDEQAICWALKRGMEQAGYRCLTFSNAEDAIKVLIKSEPVDAIMLDMRMPGMDGFQATARIKHYSPDTSIVMMTAFGDLSSAIHAMDSDIVEYLTKPFDLKDALRTIENALASKAPNQQNTKNPDVQFGTLLGTSPAMQYVYKQIAIASKTDSSVFLVGPSGTGKESVASAIHRYSTRKDGPFLVFSPVAISPIAVSLELLGSSLHAPMQRRSRSGAFELAGQGVLFIDEVADLPLVLQSQLLRVLEHGQYCPLGSTDPTHCTARIMVSTERDLEELVAEGEFLEELRQRLNVFTIELQPLQQRREDILPIAIEWLRKQPNSSMKYFSKEAERWLEGYSWPGNLRDLQAVVSRSAMLSRNNQIELESVQTREQVESGTKPSSPIDIEIEKWLQSHLSSLEERGLRVDQGTADDDVFGDMYEDFLETVERPFLLSLMKAFHGNRATIAAQLGMHRSTLRQKMRKYKID